MHRGFSLVELSIVLVILGLLTGGILAGQSLIRAAELRAVTTEYNRYMAATNSFRDKYFALPGDMTNATSFWGAAHATPATCLTTVGTGTQTCNGNGDGKIYYTAAGANQYGECYTYWQHLANAGLIEGSYTGRAGTLGGSDATATNSASSRLSNGYWFPHNWYSLISGYTQLFDGDYRVNMMQLGGLYPSNVPTTPILKPEEVWNIDTKIDDGKPARGNMIERYWDQCTNAANSADLNATYLLNDTTVQCAPIFYIK